MNRNRTAIALIVACCFVSGVAQASWYDDYDAGLAAVRKGNWSLVVQKMTAAIKGKPNEDNRARTYGTITTNYHPYYYRGVANMNLGKYEEAIADFEKTTGPGPENLGSLDVLMERAKKQLASAESEPEPARPAPTVVPAAPAPTQAVPAIDPALRQRANAAIAGAKQKIQAAQQRRATSSPQFAQAMAMFSDLTSKNAGARSNDDLNAIISMAENAGDLADLAMAPGAPTPAVAETPSKPAVVTENVLGDYKRQLRRALEYYFNGEFEDATREFETLSRRLPNNGWIFAFLGASQYSRFAFEADPAHRSAAIKSFQKVKRLRTFKGGLPERYFSKRIRKAFAETSG